MRQCYIELLALNVGIKNVMHGVRHIASIEVRELHVSQSTSVVRMFAEMKGLACQQLAANRIVR